MNHFAILNHSNSFGCYNKLWWVVFLYTDYWKCFTLNISQLHYCCDHLLYLWLSSPSVSKRYDLELLVFLTDLWFLIIPLSSSLRFNNTIVTLQKKIGTENAITQESPELNGHENEWIYEYEHKKNRRMFRFYSLT